jgi:Zn-dependent protease with chaperone function
MAPETDRAGRRTVSAVYLAPGAAPADVTLSIEDRQLRVSGPGVHRLEPLHGLQLAEPLGDAPRLVRFRDGAFCSVEDRDGFAALLASVGARPGRPGQWEGSLRWIGAGAAAFLLLLVAGYYYVVPAAAGAAAGYVPAAVVEAVSAQSLAALDNGVFEPSALPDDRQRRLAERFSSLRFPPGSAPDAYRIVFRKSDAVGPNALALPSGTIVVTDALVALSGHDDELMAVLAHEAGHVEERHGLRQVFQNSTVALVMTWLLGDVSMLAAAAPSALLQARYSRELERDADRHAIAVLDLNGVPRRHFTRMLERLEAAAREEGAASGSVLDYLSSHPVTSDRIEAVGR